MLREHSPQSAPGLTLTFTDRHSSQHLCSAESPVSWLVKEAILRTQGVCAYDV